MARRALVAVGVMAFLGVPLAGAGASSTSIGFDDLPAGTTLASQYAARGVTFTASASSPQPVVDALGPATSSPPNAAAIQGCSTTIFPNGLASAAGALSAGQQTLSVQVGARNSGTLFWTLIASDASGAQVATARVQSNGAGVSTPLSLTSPQPNIASFVLSARGCYPANPQPEFDDLTFAAPSPPAVVTGGATDVTATSATLNGTVDPQGSPTSAGFVFGPSGSENQTPAQNIPASAGATATSAAVAGLLPATTYRFHLHASNAAGSSDGAEQTFTTAANAPGPPPSAPPPGPRPAHGPLNGRLTAPSRPALKGKLVHFSFPSSPTFPRGTLYLWRFGDRGDRGLHVLKGGLAVRGQLPSINRTVGHRYEGLGKLKLLVEAIAPNGAEQLIVRNQPVDPAPAHGGTHGVLPCYHFPTAAFSVYDAQDTNTPVQFDASASTQSEVAGCPPPGILTYSWDFGDGTRDAGVHPQHTFTTPGNFVVRLTVHSSQGSDTVSQTVIVAPGEQCAPFTVNQITITPSTSCLQAVAIGDPAHLDYLSSGPLTVDGLTVTNAFSPHELLVSPPSNATFGVGSISSFPDDSEAHLLRFYRPDDLAVNNFVAASLVGSISWLKPDASGDASTPNSGLILNPGRLYGGLVGRGPTTLHLHPGDQPATLDVTGSLPPPFVAPFVTAAYSTAPTAQPSSTLSIPDASFGPIETKNVTLTSDTTGLHGTGDLVLFPELGGLSIHAGPPAPLGGFGFGPDGSFNYAGAQVTFPEPIPVAPLAGLSSISAGFQLKPFFELVGQASFDSLAPLTLGDSPVFRVNGCFNFIAEPGVGQSTPLCNENGTFDPPFEAVVQPDQANHKLIRITGAGVFLPGVLGGVNLGNAAFDYVTPHSFDLVGQINWDLPLHIASVDGTLSARFQDSGTWQADNSLDVCVLGVCEGGDLLVSSKGAAACVSVNVLFADVSLGASILWSDLTPSFTDSCDLASNSPARVFGTLEFANAATDGVPSAFGGMQSARFRLPPSRTPEVISVSGIGHSPTVVLTGPNGARITDPGHSTDPHARLAVQVIHADTQTVSNASGVHAAPGNSTTYFLIARPVGGGWTATVVPGSSPISRIATSAQRARPQIKITLRRGGHGTELLTYAIGGPGEQVTFAEQGAARRIIGNATGKRGTISFVPMPGAAGTRRILALRSHNSIPDGVVTVGSYRYAGLPRLGPVGGLRLRTAGTRLLIRWRARAGASGYLVRLVLGDGRRITVPSPPGKRTITVPDYPRTDSATVTVVALDALQRSGVRTTARSRARARRPSPVVI